MAINYLVALLTTSLATFLLGAFVIVRSPRRPLNRIFGLYSWSIATWSAGQALHSVAPDVPQSLWWAYLSHYGVAFIPTFFVHFVLSFLGFSAGRKRRVLIPCYALSVLFAVVNGTPLYIAGVTPKFSLKYFIEPGFFYPFSVAFFGLCTVYGLIKLFQAYTKASGALRNQLKYLCWSSLLGYLGGAANFFLVFDLEIVPWNPFGTYAVPLYVLATAYAIVRYRLMDITLAITRTGILLGVYTLVVGGPLLLGLSFRSALIDLFGARWWVAPLVLYTVAAFAGPFLYLYFQRKVEQRLLRDQRRYQQTLLSASSGMTQIRDLARLCRLIVHVITKAVGLRHAAIFLYEPKEEVFVLAARRYGPPDGARLSKNDPVAELLRQVRKPVVLAELKAQLGETDAKDAVSRKTARALAWMESQHASVLVPSFAQESLIGFLVLGEKRSTRIFTTEDLSVFATLANQAALAIENARFYQSEKERQAALFHSASLASLGTMASSMSHQVNNRFNVMSVIGGIRKEALQQLLARDLQGPAEWRKALEEDLAQFDSVREEALRGGQIVAAIRKIIKPSTEGHQPLAIADAVHAALRVVQYKVPLDMLDLALMLPEELPKISGDLPQLGECFFNFVDNAWDAIKERQERLKPPSDYKGTIRIQATAATTRDPQAKRTRSELLLTVSDNGIGVKPEDLAKLFVPFFTTKATAEKGTGLGLYVIKKIIEAHGGTITADSTYGQGTTFTIHLPAFPPGTHEQPLPRPPQAA